jgi:glycyl-tRNA synthetase
MSEALYVLGGLRFWTENEIELREAFQARLAAVMRRALLDTNPAWRIMRVEGPCLSPRSKISAAYSDDDVFVTNHIAGSEPLCLRAETTPSSYAWAKQIGGKLPLCVWQAGKSFRRETNDGAKASKLRFNEFWQQEFQCIYRADTANDYRAKIMPEIVAEVARFTGLQVRIVPSDRLPDYAQSTLDIEALFNGEWREVASCSIRTDYAPDTLVAEFAIGLCRVATMADAPSPKRGIQDGG